jgi:transcriptional regulator with XRE-family HTH domain
MTITYQQVRANLIQYLAARRIEGGITALTLANALGVDEATFVAMENLEHDPQVADLDTWMGALNCNYKQFLTDVAKDMGFGNEVNTSLPAVPISGKARAFYDPVTGQEQGTIIAMGWQGQERDVFIAGLPVVGYLRLETQISAAFKALNNGGGDKNRNVIFQMLSDAICQFPNVNPSDIYHHIVYRIYLRDYKKTQADRSWVRAGGEAFELFLEWHYNNLLATHGISLLWLCNDQLRASALGDMAIQSQVGGSKLDLALYGTVDGRKVIFGGIHAKASLAERVSDDVPCSEAMMRNGYCSYLVTLDAKSFPPPKGNLVNIGEFGTPDVPSDKRHYIERHGSFDACFSYNLRTVPSALTTPSGRRIFVSTFNPQTDPLPAAILAAWNSYLGAHLGA